METITITLHPELLKQRPSTVLSHTVNAFSAYVSNGLPVIRPELMDDHMPEVGYVQRLVYDLLNYAIKGNRFQEEAHIPLKSECEMLLNPIGLKRTMRIVNMAFDCYLFENDKVLRTGEVIDLLHFMQVRDFIGHLLLGYSSEYHYQAIEKPLLEAAKVDIPLHKPAEPALP
jgi:hypothetical protein